MSLLGIDVGTTGCKAAAFAEDGTHLAGAYREYPTQHPQPGWAELDSAAVLADVLACIGQAASAVKATDPVSAVSISSMGEAVVPVSAGGEVLGRSILSSDDRGGLYVQPLIDRLGREGLYRINPNVPGPAYSLPKLLWLRDHRPDEFRAAWKYLLWGDLVGFVLTGRAATSYAHANRTMLFDIRRADWSDDLLGLVDLPRDLLGECVPGGAEIGPVRPAMAERLGLAPQAKVYAGAHDQCCNALGAGVIEPGKAVDGIGTYECITPAFAEIPDDAARMLEFGLCVEHHVIDGLYVTFLYNQAGALVRWFRDSFAPERRDHRDIYDALAAEMPDAPSDVIVLPTFDATGSPAFLSGSTGAIAGLRNSTTRGDVLTGIMQSVTFWFVESLDALRSVGADTSELVATGGGARSDPWLQIKADILNVPITRLANPEATVAGAAMRAGLSTGAFATPAEAVAAFVRRGRTFEPDPARHQQYQPIRQRYRKLLTLLGEFILE